MTAKLFVFNEGPFNCNDFFTNKKMNITNTLIINLFRNINYVLITRACISPFKDIYYMLARKICRFFFTPGIIIFHCGIARGKFLFSRGKIIIQNTSCSYFPRASAEENLIC